LCGWSGNIAPLDHLTPSASPEDATARVQRIRRGRHDHRAWKWRVYGFPGVSCLQKGFPRELIEQFGARDWPQNDSETTRLRHRDHQELGEEHMRTGSDCLYVGRQRIQIAAHEDVIPIAELYRMCESRANCSTDRQKSAGHLRAPSPARQEISGAPSAAMTMLSSRRDPCWLDVLAERKMPVFGIGRFTTSTTAGAPSATSRPRTTRTHAELHATPR